MYRIRWDRVLAFGVLLSLPLGLDWLRANLSVGDFGAVPVLGEACQNPEAKGLVLITILLAGVYFFVKTLLRE